jgi:hypothetical protein
MRRRRKRGPGRGRDELRTTSSEAGPGGMCEEDKDEHHDDERDLLRRSSLLLPGAETVFGLGVSCPMPVGRLTVRRATTILKCKVVWLIEKAREFRWECVRNKESKHKVLLGGWRRGVKMIVGMAFSDCLVRMRSIGVGIRV